MNVNFQTVEKGGKAATVEWYTPPEIIHSLGEFDLDPATSLQAIRLNKSARNRIDMIEIKNSTVRDLINELFKIEDRSKIIVVNGKSDLDIQENSDSINIVTTE